MVQTTWSYSLFGNADYFFLLKIIIFYAFRLFWCIDFKINFLKIKNIILIYF
jgi:hypothetical protein